MPVLDPQLSDAALTAIEAELGRNGGFWGALGHRVASTALSEPVFDARRYWRGPVWPVTNWLLVQGLAHHGRHEEAERIACATLRLLAERGLAEYLSPLTGAAGRRPRHELVRSRGGGPLQARRRALGNVRGKMRTV
jgi:Mannosylglycerate hydrolase MGH1-like glycoside hydrolase domain